MRHVTPEESNRAWRATLERRYDEALALWDDIIASYAPNVGSLNNRAVSRLLAGDLDGALADYRTAQQLAPHVGMETVGMALWLKGQREAACADWALQIEQIRSHVITHAELAYPPALLWWASAHSGLKQWRQLALQELHRCARTRQCRHPDWPGSIAPYLLGRISAEELLAAAVRPLGKFARFLCQAHFYIGAKHLEVGAVSDYRRHLSIAISGDDPSVIIEHEYHLAQAELAALHGDEGFGLRAL